MHTRRNRSHAATEATRGPWRTALSLSALTALMIPTVVLGQGAPPPAAAAAGSAVIQDFEKPDAGWSAIRISEKGVQPDAVSTVTVTQEAAEVKEGKGALKYEYPAAADGIGVLVGPASLKLKGPQSVSFWLKTSQPATIAWTLSEQDESRYSVEIPSPAGRWQHVQLSLSDFTLTEDTKDENNQLDAAQVNGMSFLDVTAMRRWAEGEKNPSRQMWIDQISVSDQPASVPVRPAKGGKEVVVDDFEGQQPKWLSLTLTGLTAGKLKFVLDTDTKIRPVAKDPAEGEGALEADYFAPEGGVLVLQRLLSRKLPLEGATHLRLSVKSKYDARMMVRVEEKDNSGYEAELPVGGGETWQRHEVQLKTLKLARDSKDENKKLDLDQVQEVLLVDISGLTGEPGPNTVWIDEVAFFVPGR